MIVRNDTSVPLATDNLPLVVTDNRLPSDLYIVTQDNTEMVTQDGLNIVIQG